MGHTLDELLDATGISNMSGGMRKTASEKKENYFLKLAERCQRAATATPAETRSSKDIELAEKTAGVAVIAQTMSEIESIAGEQTKVASEEDLRVAAFVKTALDQGHPVEEIAAFIKRASLADKAFRSWHGGVGKLQHFAGKVIGGASEALDLAARRRDMGVLRNAAHSMDPQAANRLLETMRTKYGDEMAAEVLQHSGAKLHHLPSARDLLKKFPGEDAVSLTAGGKTYGLSKEHLSKLSPYAIGGAVGGGGAVAGKHLLGGGGDEDGGGKKRHGNVTIIQ